MGILPQMLHKESQIPYICIASRHTGVCLIIIPDRAAEYPGAYTVLRLVKIRTGQTPAVVVCNFLHKIFIRPGFQIQILGKMLSRVRITPVLRHNRPFYGLHPVRNVSHLLLGSMLRTF